MYSMWFRTFHNICNDISHVSSFPIVSTFLTSLKKNDNDENVLSSCGRTQLLKYEAKCLQCILSLLQNRQGMSYGGFQYDAVITLKWTEKS